VGLCLPYACDVRPVTDVWRGSPASVLPLAVPLVAAVLWGLLELAPPVAAGLERRGAAWHGALRAVYLLLAGAYLVRALGPQASGPERLGVAAALLVTGGLLVWQQGRGTKAQRVPLLLLAIAGIPVVVYPVATEFALQVGGWLVTAGWALGVMEEARLLAATPPVVRGG
jgi:hypothetical protein